MMHITISIDDNIIYAKKVLLSVLIKLKCTCKYCVDCSICHFKFPKLVLAHTIGEVCNFCIVLLSVSSRTCLTIFIEMGLYLADTQSKKYIGTFFRHGV